MLLGMQLCNLTSGRAATGIQPDGTAAAATQPARPMFPLPQMCLLGLRAPIYPFSRPPCGALRAPRRVVPAARPLPPPAQLQQASELA